MKQMEKNTRLMLKLYKAAPCRAMCMMRVWM
jgi:hypothetical protein